MERARKRVMIACIMRDFEVLFDHGEEPELRDPVMDVYGKLGFPVPVAGRPWVYANFVQTMDGIVSLLGDEAGGADIAESAEDRWLMDLLRAHADASTAGDGNSARRTKDGASASARAGVPDRGRRAAATEGKVRSGQRTQRAANGACGFPDERLCGLRRRIGGCNRDNDPGGCRKIWRRSASIVRVWTSSRWMGMLATEWICSRQWRPWLSGMGSDICCARADRRCIRECLLQD